MANRVPGACLVASRCADPPLHRTRLVALVPTFRLLAPVESVGELGRAIKAQLDLRIEAANNERFTASFAGDPDVCATIACTGTASWAIRC